MAEQAPRIVCVLGDPRIRRSTDEVTDVRTFEQVVVRNALRDGQRYGTMVTPVVCQVDSMMFRPWSPVLPLRAGENEMLLGLSFHPEQGIDVTRQLLVRRPNGEPVFDDLQELHADRLSVDPRIPGFQLMQRLTAV